MATMVTTLYAEPDKLGPLATKVSAIHDPVALRTLLLRELASAVQVIQDAAGAVDRGAADAVHEARKALRRARAVLSMVGAALPKREARAIRRELQHTRRSLSAARDHAVAPETLAQLTLDDDELATARRILDNAAAARPTRAELGQLLADGATRAAAQREALAAALPQELGWDVVAAGIRSVYAEARRARRCGKRSKAGFHTWRRRSKEIICQLEVVAHHAGPRIAALRDELDEVAKAMSPAVDLIMLREFVATHAEGIAPDAVDQLVATIDARLVEVMKDARKAGRDAFCLKPRRFEKRLAKAVERDLLETRVDAEDRSADEIC